MNQQPDKIFREKLHEYQKPVSAHAWSKLEGKLDQKRGVPLWMKIAASLLVVLSVLGLLLTNRFSDSQVADVKTPTQVTPPTQVQPEVEEKVTVPAQDDSIDNVKSQVQKQVKKPSPNSQKRKREPETIVNPQHVPVTEITVAEHEPVKELPVVEETNTVEISEMPSETVPDNTNVVIVYSANEVNEKYLIKKETSQATSENEKPSTLQKLWSKAKDLKHNQDPFGDLRQKKNEILALDFKKEEQRNQNR